MLLSVYTDFSAGLFHHILITVQDYFSAYGFPYMLFFAYPYLCIYSVLQILISAHACLRMFSSLSIPILQQPQAEQDVRHGDVGEDEEHPDPQGEHCEQEHAEK